MSLKLSMFREFYFFHVVFCLYFAFRTEIKREGGGRANWGSEVDQNGVQ